MMGLRLSTVATTFSCRFHRVAFVMQPVGTVAFVAPLVGTVAFAARPVGTVALVA